MRFTSCNIPVQLCQWALKNKKVRELQVFLWLKLHCSGKIRINQEVLQKLTCDLGLKSVKTVKSSLTSLMDKHWVTQSKRSGYYFIKGFESIRRMERFDRRTAVEFSLSDIKKVKGFLISVVITNLIGSQKRRERAIEREKGHSKTLVRKPPIFFPIATGALAKILGVSISTAWEYKKIARRQKFIRIRKSRAELKMDTHEFRNMRKYGEEAQVNKFRYEKDKIQEFLPDKIATNLRLTRRKKIFR